MIRRGCRNSFTIPFMYGFSRKMFLMLYSINWSNFIVWLPFLIKILGNMCIAIICFPGYDVINFEINVICLIKPFFGMTKKSEQNFKYLENQKCFCGKIKSIFLSFLKNFQSPKIAWYCTFKMWTWNFQTSKVLSVLLKNQSVKNYHIRQSPTQPTFTCSKSKTETLEGGVNTSSETSERQNIRSTSSTSFFWRFYSWPWTSKYYLGNGKTMILTSSKSHHENIWTGFSDFHYLICNIRKSKY